MREKSRLLAAIYSTTLAPDRFDDVFIELDDVLFGNRLGDDLDRDASDLTPGMPRQSPIFDADVLRHVEIARDIQKQSGRDRRFTATLSGLAGAMPLPTVALDGRGQIFYRNALADRRWPPEAKAPEEWLPAELVSRLRSFCAPGNAETTLVLRLFHDEAGDVLLLRKVVMETAGVAETLTLASFVDFGFDGKAVARFREAFEMTAAEADIAVQIAEGRAISEIALRRNASEQTVRTQIKAIKWKTGVADMPALVRLLCGFCAGIVIPEALAEADGARGTTLTWTSTLTLRDGRRMDVLEQGQRDGRPVLLIHNMPYGTELPAAAIAAAADAGLRIIAPYRPGHGSSDAVATGDVNRLLDTVADDLADLCRQYGLKRVPVVGHTIGSAYALRFASRHPGLVTRIIAVSKVPVWRTEWLPQMPMRHRLVLHIAVRFPQLLALIGWSITTMIDRGLADSLVQGTVRGCGVDEQFVRQPETAKLIRDGLQVGLRQGADAFLADCVLAARDMTAEAAACPHSFHIIHGAADQVVRPDQTLAFVADVPGSTVELIPGAGQLLFYSHWPVVLSAMKRYAEPQPLALPGQAQASPAAPSTG